MADSWGGARYVGAVIENSARFIIARAQILYIHAGGGGDIQAEASAVQIFEK